MGVGLRVLERVEPRVTLERLGEALRSRSSDAVGDEAAGEGGTSVSAAADALGDDGQRRT